MHISIPSGSFEVARACSGLNYFTTSLVLGFLYAYVNYRGWLKRVACVAAFVVIPVILNGLRVYITILVSHLTEMRFGPGTEHVTFGRIFFVVMMLALFWIGRRWHDEMPSAAEAASGRQPGSVAPRTTWWPLPIGTLLALAGPPFAATSIARAAEHLADRESLAVLPAPAPGWQGPRDARGRWRPLYTGGLVERQAIYETADGRPVDVFVAIYGLGTGVGAEMISYKNVIFPEEHGSLAEDAYHVLALPDGTSLKVREVVAEYSGDRKLVWHWFVVGEQPVVNPFTAKALEALAFVTRSAHSERIVAINTPLDDAAAQRLESFIRAYGNCVALGFPVEACGG
jgi:EpsI family protein